jgi:hypothetical protein
MLGGITLKVDRATDFPMEVVLTEEGVHEFVLEAWDAAGNHALTSITVIRDTLPPDLSVEAVPLLTNDPRLRVAGRCTDTGVPAVKVGGAPVSVDEHGAFTTELLLVEGPNFIEVRATDGAGNSVSTMLTVELDTFVNATIVLPREGDIIHGELVTVVVQTEPLAHLRVRGRTPWATADESGLAELNYTSGPAKDLRIVVELQDVAGNEATREVTVTVGGPRVAWAGGPAGAALLLLLMAVAAAVTIGTLLQRRRRRAAG